MFVQPPVQKSREFTVRTLSNDQALVKERRRHIVRCSTRVFTKKGYDRTSMREPARACGMSASRSYHCSGSKEEILYSIINSVTSQQASYVADCASELAAVSPRTALVELMRKYYHRHDHNQDVILFWHQETLREHPAFGAHLEEQIAGVLKAIETDDDAGVIRAPRKELAK